MSARLSLLVIGGGPAGLSAARSYREAGGRGLVAIVADEHRMPYQRPPLTKDLLRGDSTEEALPIERESWLAEHEVSLISGRAVALDADAHSVALSGGRELKYDQLVLATGAEPTRLPVPGADDPAVRVLRTLDHLRELQQRLSQTIEYIKTFKPAQFDGGDTKEVTFPVGPDSTRTLPGQQFLNQVAFPNFYFHAATAHGILRHNGVEIGKRDFLGIA